MILEDSRLLVVIAVLLGVVAAAIVGVVIWLITALSRSRRVPKPAEPESTTLISEPLGEPDLLSLRRTPEGAWQIIVRGQQVTRLEAVPDDETRRQVVAGLRELAAFARGYVQSSQAAATGAAPTTPPRAEAASASAITPPAPTAGTRRTSQPESRRTPEPTLMPVIDLASEVSSIINELQREIPALEHRTIRLRGANDGRVQFEVDGKHYVSIEDIPETDIRALIRRATQEWERR